MGKNEHHGARRTHNPLCPVARLPLKGEDRLVFTLSPFADGRGAAWACLFPISPLEGEMSGRTERCARLATRHQ
ncbi:hypothetical protein EYC79_13240 [Agrobacterium cavarae]|uniref:Lytic murein transglycosylase n=1 Tax=Agrobacterium cavarae TaxID=2528239 RepID=A0ABY1YAL0_9HYPH|nr:hypothetical protein EYC79_13240 [Agrobacterium cavarae]